MTTGRVGMNEYSFPMSRDRVKDAGFDAASDNPLAFLHPHEARAAELFVLAEGDPITASTMPSGPARTWSVLRSGTYLTRWQGLFGFEMTRRHRAALEGNPAWRAYVNQLRTKTAEAVLARLEADGLEAYTHYTEARKMALKAEDYRELGKQAGDHLDRIGATKKPQPPVQQAVVIIRGRNFDETTLDKQLPEPEIEVVQAEE